MQSRVAQAVAEAVTARPRRVLATVALVSLPCAWLAAGVPVDRGNEAMNAAGNAARRTYAEFRSAFGSDSALLLTVTDPALLSADGLRRLEELQRGIESLPDVRRVDSLLNAVEIVRAPEGASTRDLVPPFDTPDFEARLKAAVARNPQLIGALLSADGRTAGMLVIPTASFEHRPGPLVAGLRGLIDAQCRGPVECHLTGAAVQKHEVAALVRRDERVLVPVALAVMAALLAFAFRRPAGVVLPLAAALASLSVTLGLYALGGFTLNPITSLLPPVVLVLSISTTVHVYDAWQRQAPEKGEGRARVATAVEEVFLPCMLAALTTAFGLSSLGVSAIPAVRWFGLFSALGVLVSFVLGIAVVGAGLCLLRAPRAPSRPRFVVALVEPAGRLPAQHPGPVVLVAVAVVAVAARGLPRLVADTDLVRFLPPAAPLARDTRFIDHHFTGPYPVELFVRRRDGEPLGPGDVRAVAAITRIAQEDPVVGSVWSAVPFLARVNAAEQGAAEPVLPETWDELAAALELLRAGDSSGRLDAFVDQAGARWRVRLNLHAAGSRALRSAVKRILTRASSVLPPDLEASPTGELYLVAVESDRLVREQVESFSLAFVLVFAAMGIALRSLRLLGVAIAPNLVPIAVVLGWMGWRGIPLDSGTVMVAATCLGIVVDDTIHYLTALRARGATPPTAAIRSVARQVGPPMVLTTVVLTAGFLVGWAGSFRPARFFSALTGLALVTAILCDLFLLPALWVLLRRPVGAAVQEEGTCCGDSQWR